MSEKLSNYTTSPTEDRSNWMVWDMYEELPPKLKRMCAAGMEGDGIGSMYRAMIAGSLKGEG